MRFRCQTAILRASRARSVRTGRQVVCQPMILREYTSVMKATQTHPEKARTQEGAPPACGGMSATHSPPRAKASKWRLARSAGHWSFGAERVVLGDLARLTPRRPRSPMSRTGGTTGHVTGTVTPGSLGSAPHHVHPAGPQHRVAGSYGPWVSPP